MVDKYYVIHGGGYPPPFSLIKIKCNGGSKPPPYDMDNEITTPSLEFEFNKTGRYGICPYDIK